MRTSPCSLEATAQESPQPSKLSSSSLRAIPLEADDIYGRDPAGRATVQVTFEGITGSDQDVFRQYATGTQMVLTRVWDAGNVRITGRGLQFAPFAEVREAQGGERTRRYKTLRAEEPELALPEATNMADVDSAMLEWEMGNPERCGEAEQDAGHFFGFTGVGQSAITSRFRFVFVPGLRDAAEEAVERRGSLLEQLLTAIATQRAQANERLSDLERETRERYAEVIEESHGPTLRGLAESLEEHMQRYVPSAGISLNPVQAQLKVGAPLVELRAGEAQGRHGSRTSRALASADFHHRRT